MSDRISLARLVSSLVGTLILLVGAVWIDDASAQDRYMQLAREYAVPRAFHEAVALPGVDGPQVLVTFRIPNSLLVFVRQDDRFVANPEVTVSIIRSGEAVAERSWRGMHEAVSFDATQDDLRDVAGHVVFSLDPGRYTYELSLSDDMAGVLGAARRMPFSVGDFDSDPVGRPFFAAVTGSAGVSRLDLANLGGDVPFGSNVPVQIPLTGIEEGDRLTYRLYRINRGLEERRGFVDRLLDPDAYELDEDDELISEGTVVVDGASGVGDLESGCACWSGSAAGHLAALDLETDALENAAYLLAVELARDGGTRHTTRSVFTALWRDMPLSLYDVEAAVRNLEFIESRDQIRSLLRGSRAQRIERFRAYWSARDPSPDTPYNELMAEYYRRVDTAARRFQTGTSPYADGLRTDAARVYIVHGPPDDISNTFPSDGGVVQVWTYPDGRRFSFRAASSLDALELQSTPETATQPSGSG